ncbi:hypothetical protein EZS27_018976, partial [termite gut metagenome]
FPSSDETEIKMLFQMQENVGIIILTFNALQKWHVIYLKLAMPKLDADYFFAHPYSSWERGLNEYTNKLIRQYIPKKQTFTDYNDDRIKKIQLKINRRPRKKLNFEEPYNLFYKMLNNIVAFNT